MSIPAGARVVVVGGGIAGMGAALRLAERGAAVVLLEAAPELGGACRAVRVELPFDGALSVDVGVSDFNRATFHQLDALLGGLDVPVRPVCQDASFRASDGRWLWSSRPGGVELSTGLQRGFVNEIERFKREAATVHDPTLAAGAWLRASGFSEAFQRLYFAPRALGCFPAPDVPPMEMPIAGLARFWAMHGLVGPGPADRVCAAGGMHRYVGAVHDRLVALGVDVRTGERVERIARDPLVVYTARGPVRGDRLVLAVEPAVALRLLARPTRAERAVLGACPAQRGRVVLHGDPRLMPRDPQRWAAYNYVVPGGEAVPGPTITFFPERLARLAGPLPPLFVTLNPHVTPRAVHADLVFAHPVLGRDPGVDERLARLQGTGDTWFCGAWTREPFLHEQGLGSGIDVAEAVAADLERAREIVGASAG